MDETKELWKKAAEFHGHVCGGLTIGYKAALYAIELLGITFPQMSSSCVSRKMMPAAAMLSKRFWAAA